MSINTPNHRPQMTREQIEARVREIVGEVQNGRPGPVEITDATKLAADLDFDSLDFADLAVSLEDAFDIDLTEREIEEAGATLTFGQLVELVAGKIGVMVEAA